MKKLIIFIFLLTIPKPTVCQWVLDYQFSQTGTISIRGISVTDSNYVWITTVDSVNNSYIYKRINNINLLLNNGNIDRPEKIISIDSSIAYLCSFGQKLYYTSNSGNNWLLLLNENTFAYPYFEISNNNTGSLIVSTMSLDSGYNKVYVSNNSGLNWIRQNILFPENSETYDVSITDPNHMWVGVNCTDVSCPDMRYYFTTNAGINWQLRTFTLISNNVRMDAPVFKQDNMFGLIFSPGFNMYLYSTSNGGTNWFAPYLFISGNYYDVKLFNVDSTQIWYWVTQKKIFKSTNDGTNWSEMTISINDPDYIRGVSFKKFSNKIVAYAGTNKGIIHKLSETISPIGIQPVTTEIPKQYLLSQNYPNPFNPVTKIKFGIPAGGYVKLNIFDVLGRNIKTPVNENLAAGSYEIEFDGTNLPSGIYYYKLEAETSRRDLFTETKKMVLVK